VSAVGSPVARLEPRGARDVGRRAPRFGGVAAMNHLSLRTKVTMGYALCLVLALGATVSVYRAVALSEAATARVTMVSRTITAADRLLRAVVDAETGERGFLLTGTPAFLGPYNDGVKAFEQASGDLRTLAAAPEQAARLDTIRSLFDQWVTVAAIQIAARRASPAGLSAAAQAAYATVLDMRKTAAEYARSRRSETLAQWMIDTTALRSQLGAVTTLEQSKDGLTALQAAFTLVDEAADVGPNAPASRMLAIGAALDGIVSARVNAALAGDARVAQSISANGAGALVDQIRENETRFSATAETELQASLAANRQAAARAQAVAIGTPVILLVLLAVAIVVSNGVTASIRDVAGAAAALAAGDFTRRVRARGTDEVGVMARAYNTMADRLSAQVREATLLHQMGELLQASLSIDDACRVIASLGPQLFPAHAGAVYVTAASRDRLESLAAWGVGNGVPLAEVFGPEECWALRRGQPHVFRRAAAAVACAHLPEPLPAASECVPLMAQGETLGILFLAAADPAAPPAFSEPETRLARAVADQIGLAIANLRLRETLRQQSIRDALTGLYNRRYLEETLARELQRAERTERPLGVVMFDIDRFKQFNDTVGHDAGDALLRDLGAMLRQRFRKDDIACRYGGEEFVVILPDASLEATHQRAELLGDAVRHLEVDHRGQPLGSITVSLGVAAFPEHGRVMEALLRAADTALYRAKQNGRDRVELAKIPEPL